MPLNARHSLRPLFALVFLSAAFLAGCSKKDVLTEKAFVGKWRSSRLATPLYMHENGEWEIKKDDGGVLQYGTWEYQAKRIVWHYKIDARVRRDVNAVVATGPKSFELRESDQQITSFDRLD